VHSRRWWNIAVKLFYRFFTTNKTIKQLVCIVILMLPQLSFLEYFFFSISNSVYSESVKIRVGKLGVSRDMSQADTVL
jgi:hypothetical protein